MAAQLWPIAAGIEDTKLFRRGSFLNDDKTPREKEDSVENTEGKIRLEREQRKILNTF